MPVVSISLNETLLEKIENIQEELGFSGRSEIIRTALRNYIEQKTQLNELQGEQTAVLTIKHENNAELDIHDYQGLVKSQLHSHDQKGDCLQVFILTGDATKIIQLKEKLESQNKVHKANISI